MTAAGAASARRVWSDRVRGEQIRQIYHRAATGLIAGTAAGVMLALFLVRLGGVDRAAMHGWIAVVTAQALVRLLSFAVYRRLRPRDEDWRRWALVFTIGTFVGGAIWGAGSLLMIDAAHFDRQLMVVLVICALIYGALPSFGGYLPAFLAFFLPALLPSAVWSALQGDLEHQAYAVLTALWIPTIAILANSYGTSVLRTLALSYENAALLEDVQRQKDLAEQANVTKSRFLAAASHDLRQPVHALGMFIGALRAQDASPQSRRLLDHIEGSVGALDSLFAALLDVSRLDAGIISAELSTVAVGPLVERICRDSRADAEAKGIALRSVPCTAFVRSDPVLLERILRNLVANAVRYTPKGRILVGCRRRGAAIAIEVWDTGIGIDPSQRPRIFDEFFQVANPGRDRSEGLGLGLAIVRRLTLLLGHPLEVRSTPGNGSVFRVLIPATTPVDAGPPETGAAADTLPALILIIDDESAVREAARSLLESWGHRVVGAGSGAEALALAGGLSRRPDLIICDYRLGAETGIELIARLRQEFNEDIPAMLVTGDTAPDRLIEARDSGYPLLHKPVSEARLRAAIAELL